VWREEEDESYMVKSTYLNFQNNDKHRVIRYVLEGKGSAINTIFGRRVVLNVVANKGNLKHKVLITIDYQFAMCGEWGETIIHLFFRYKVAIRV